MSVNINIEKCDNGWIIGISHVSWRDTKRLIFEKKEEAEACILEHFAMAGAISEIEE